MYFSYSDNNKPIDLVNILLHIEVQRRLDILLGCDSICEHYSLYFV